MNTRKVGGVEGLERLFLVLLKVSQGVLKAQSLGLKRFWYFWCLKWSAFIKVCLRQVLCALFGKEQSVKLNQWHNFFSVSSFFQFWCFLNLSFVCWMFSFSILMLLKYGSKVHDPRPSLAMCHGTYSHGGRGSTICYFLIIYFF